MNGGRGGGDLSLLIGAHATRTHTYTENPSLLSLLSLFLLPHRGPLGCVSFSPLGLPSPPFANKEEPSTLRFAFSSQLGIVNG